MLKCITFICVICNRSSVGVNAAHPEGDGRRRPSHRRQEHGNDPFLSCRVAFKRRASKQAGRQQQQYGVWSMDGPRVISEKRLELERGVERVAGGGERGV